MLATRLRVEAKSTGVRSVLSWSLDDRTRQFLMSWLRVYTWLRVKIEAKSTGVRSVLSWNLDDRTSRSRLRVNKKKSRVILQFSRRAKQSTPDRRRSKTFLGKYCQNKTSEPH